jgi:hypothetical protein
MNRKSRPAAEAFYSKAIARDPTNGVLQAARSRVKIGDLGGAGQAMPAALSQYEHSVFDSSFVTRSFGPVMR